MTSKDPKPSARLCAAKAVHAVLTQQAQLEAALARAPGYDELASNDKAFARLIAATTMRRLGQIDLVLAAFTDRRPHGIAASILRTGAAQLIFLGTPPHAAVGESVAIARLNKKSSGFAGLINAVLRRVDQEGRAELAKTAPQDNLPKWIRRSWEKAYGRASMRRMALLLAENPPLDIYVPSGAEDWHTKIGGQRIGEHTIRLERASGVSDLPGFEDGAWWVQDIASSVPVELLGDVSGLNVLDMCSAPGGKTLQLAAKGANVTALDKSETRLARVKANLARARLQAEVVCADAAEWEAEQPYDIVLLDAPCTATGTFRRHPDVLHNKTPRDLQSLVKIQKKLLSRASDLVRPGGRLVYCTCSLQAEEGEMQVDGFLKTHPDWATALQASLPREWSLQTNPAGDYIRILPHGLSNMGGSDGFFTAVLTKPSR